MAEHLDCSPAKISRIETGRVGARTPDVRAMLDLYGASAATRDEVLGMVRGGRERPWWSEYADHIPESLSTLIGLTEDADTVEVYAPYLVPGLLQTRAYAEEAARRRQGFSQDEYERFIELRIARQRVLTGDTPPAAMFLIDEAVLRRPLSDAAVRREQLRHLVTVAGYAHVSLRVVPLTAGLTAAMGLGFTLLGFAHPAQTPVAHVDLMTGGHLVQRENEVRHYREALDAELVSALMPDASLSLINELIEHSQDPFHRLGGRPLAR